jgi:hypothetical protein
VKMSRWNGDGKGLLSDEGVVIIACALDDLSQLGDWSIQGRCNKGSQRVGGNSIMEMWDNVQLRRGIVCEV